MKPRTLHPCCLSILFVALLPSGAGANALECRNSRSETLRELEGFVEERSEISDACRFNVAAPANNRNATLSGTCERTYKFMNGYVLQLRSLLGAACGKIEAVPDCRPGQAECLQTSAAQMRAAASELEKAEKLLASARKKMDEQRGQNAEVGRAYATNLFRIKKTLEHHKSPRPRSSALLEASDVSGADAARTEGLKSLREVVRAYDLPEEPKALGARAQRIESAFTADPKSVLPENLGPFAGEQFVAYRRAGEFANAAATLGGDLRATYLALQQNAEKAQRSAALLLGPATGPATINTSPAVIPAIALAPEHASGNKSRASDLQLAHAVSTLSASEANKSADESISRNIANLETSVARNKSPMDNGQTEKNQSDSPTDSLGKNEKDPRTQASPSSPNTTALPLSQENLVVWYEPRGDLRSSAANNSLLSAPRFSAARGFAGEGSALALSPALLSANRALASARANEPIPTLDPDEPVVPQSAPGQKPEREYSLRNEIRRQLALAEERNRSASTLATASDPDAPPGEQNMRYDRRLGGLTALPGFSTPEQESFDADQEENSEDLFARIHGAHQRFVEKNLLRELVAN